MALGISIYPLLSDKKETLEYIKKASSLGFKRVFTSILEVDGERDKALIQIETYREILKYAKKLGMQVFIDVNPKVLESIGVDFKDLSFFVDLGCTGIRLDDIFNGIYESMMTYNEFGLDIEINGSLNSSYINNIVDFRANKKKLVVCHNFYPEEYTGLSKKHFISCMQRHKGLGLKVAAFVNANKGGMQGPWAANDGLSTLEVHRHKDILAQAQELIALGVDDILIGNAFATDEELNILAKMQEGIIKLKMTSDRELTSIEKGFLNTQLADRNESSDLVIRYSMSKITLKDVKIASDREETITVKKGTILLNNDNYLNYKGELLIAKQNIKIDNRRNVVGYIDEDYLDLLEYICTGKSFSIL